MKPLYERLPGRNDVLAEATRKCLDTLYRLSTPPITWKNLLKLSKQDESGEKTMWQDHYYIPAELKHRIIEWYKDAYKVESEWTDDIELLKKYLEVHPFGNRKPLEEVVGGDKVEEVLGVIDECEGFYGRDRDSSTFEWTMFNLGPTTNADTVKEYWKSYGKEITIDEKKYQELIEEI